MPNKNRTDIELPDLQKVMAVFSQAKEMPPFPDGVHEEKVAISYINKDNRIVSRPAVLLLPESDGSSLPLIYMSHYELIKESLEVINYLNQGWAVASPAEFSNLYNAQLTDDDLVFNNAALYYFTHRPEIDRERIAVTGGSAGGYMTLMLSALQLGICCSAARSALVNLYFNMNQYAPYISTFNEAALMELNEKDRTDYRICASRLPLPFANALKLFRHEEPARDHAEMLKRYEAVSPVGIINAVSAPFVEMHYTSDLLVPVDQITRKYTYNAPGKTLPDDFRMKLTDYPLPDGFDKALDEVLPESMTEVCILPVPEEDEDDSIYFSNEKTFTIAVYDEGAPESYAGHGKSGNVLSDIPFIQNCFEKKRKKTNSLNEEKAKMLVERYAGKSINLPSHEGINDSVYGSLAVYRKEIIESLQIYQAEHPEEDIPSLIRNTVKDRPELLDDARNLCKFL